VLGAGVVLATFFFREVKRDDLGGLVSDIQRARDVAFIKKQFDNLLEHMPQKLPEWSGRDKFTDAGIATEEERKYLTDIASDVVTDEELTIAARLDADALSKVSEMKKLLEEATISLNQAGPSLMAVVGGSKEDRDADADRTNARLNELNPLVGRLKTESEDYSKFLESAVERKKEIAEQSYKFYSRVCYWFLFPLGWMLGVVGKLLGQDTDGD
jgi:hypothetical protein